MTPINAFIVAVGMVAAAVAFAIAQTPVVPRTQPRDTVGYLVVAACGTLPAPAYVAGSYASPTVDVAGKLCVNQ